MKGLRMEYASQQQYQTAKSAAKPIAVGSFAEGLAGGAAVALAIIGLADIYPFTLLYVGIIAVGAAFLFESSAHAVRLSKLMSEVGGRGYATEITGGMSAGFIGGLASVTLGILCLLGIVPEILAPVAAIVFGATLVSASGSTARMGKLLYPETDRMGLIAQESSNAAAGMQSLIGLGVITLGILALIGIAPLTLNLIAVLAVGASTLLMGTTIGSRMVGAFGH